MEFEGRISKGKSGIWYASLLIVRREGENGKNYQQFGYGPHYEHPDRVNKWKGSHTPQEELKKLFGWLIALPIFDEKED